MRTDWGVPVRKSRIGFQREEFRLSSCWGMRVFKVELKSMNSIFTYVFLKPSSKGTRYCHGDGIIYGAANCKGSSEDGSLDLIRLLSKHQVGRGSSSLLCRFGPQSLRLNAEVIECI